MHERMSSYRVLVVLMVIVTISVGIRLGTAAGLGGRHKGSADSGALGNGERDSGKSGNAVHLKRKTLKLNRFVAARQS